jgi:hypothetical protein
MISLYVTSFNDPIQFQLLIESMVNYDSNFIIKTDKYLINNSTDDSFNEYDDICKKWNFTHLKFNNLGIVGARVFAANHFHSSNSNYYFYFEDDMLFEKEGKCKYGIEKHSKDLFDKLIGIMEEKKFDFLKLSYCEFQISNEYDWVKSLAKSKFKSQENLVKTTFTNKDNFRSLTYLEGEIYFCNWPMIMSKEGNRKCLIGKVSEKKYEYQIADRIHKDICKGLIKSAVLLMSPINHTRMKKYSELRKEF